MIISVVKKEVIKESARRGNAIVSDKVKDHGNDPFVLKKLEEAKAFIRKNGLNGLSGYPNKPSA